MQTTWGSGPAPSPLQPRAPHTVTPSHAHPCISFSRPVVGGHMSPLSAWHSRGDYMLSEGRCGPGGWQEAAGNVACCLKLVPEGFGGQRKGGVPCAACPPPNPLHPHSPRALAGVDGAVHTRVQVGLLSGARHPGLRPRDSVRRLQLGSGGPHICKQAPSVHQTLSSAPAALGLA